MKKYSVIYADPPWQYRVYSKKGLGRSAESHYPTMRLEDIKALPVGELADKDCALFMWITFPCMQEAFQVLDAWGFAYKTVAFVWIKQNRVSDSLFWGMGYSRSCVFSPQKAIRSGQAPVSTRSLSVTLKSTPKSRRKLAAASSSSWAMSRASNSSPDSPPKAGMFGAMRSNAASNLERRFPMAFVPVPKDLNRVKTKVMFNLTKRQLICFALAAAAGVPVFFLTKPGLGISTSAMLMVVIMLPFIFFALYEKDGQPAEKILGHVVKSMFLRDKVRPYRTNNLYAVIQQEIKEQEELRIEEQHKGSST